MTRIKYISISSTRLDILQTLRICSKTIGFPQKLKICETLQNHSNRKSRLVRTQTLGPQVARASRSQDGPRSCDLGRGPIPVSPGIESVFSLSKRSKRSKRSKLSKRSKTAKNGHKRSKNGLNICSKNTSKIKYTILDFLA